MWIRVVDLDHHVGNNTLDVLSVDQMYIEVTTQPIQPGAVITLPPIPVAPGDATAIDADDQDANGFWDIVVGTANGLVYKLVGFAGGLQTPGAAYFQVPGGARIVGVKFANITTSRTGLEIVVASGNNARVLTGDGASGIQLALITPATSAAITSLGAGDVDGDGDDDIVLATDTPPAGLSALLWYRNGSPSTGTLWTAYNIEPLPAGTAIGIHDIDLGDGNKSQYLGR